MDSQQTKFTERRTYTVTEAAAVAGVGTMVIYRGVKAGTIPHLKAGRVIRIPIHAFHQWVDTAGGQLKGGSNAA
jgi:excisionase family DNA binding protein